MRGSPQGRKCISATFSLCNPFLLVFYAVPAEAFLAVHHVPVVAGQAAAQAAAGLVLGLLFAERALDLVKGAGPLVAVHQVGHDGAFAVSDVGHVGEHGVGEQVPLGPVLHVRTFAVQVLVDGPGRLASLAQGGDDQGRAGVHVAAGEDVRQGGLEGVGIGRQGAPAGFLQRADAVLVETGQLRLLTDGREHRIHFEQGLGTLYGHRPAASGVVRFAQLHLDVFHMGDAPGLVLDDPGGRGQEQVFDPFLLGPEDLLDVGGHLVLGPAVHEGHVRAEAEAGPGRVDGGVAAAHDHDLAAHARVHPQTDLGQEFGAGGYALGVLVLDAQVEVHPRAYAEEYGLEPFLVQRVEGEVLAEELLVAHVDAEVENALDLPVEDLLGQPVFGNAVAQLAAELGHGFEDGRAVAQAAQEEGCGQPGGSAADHGHLAAGVRGAGDGQPGPGVHLPVRGEPLDHIDAHRLVHVASAAHALARVRADAADGQRHGDALADGLQRSGIVAARDLFDVPGNVDLTGAALAAGGQAVGLQVEVRDARGHAPDGDHAARTDLLAAAAGGAQVGVHHGVAVGAHLDGPELAGGDAGAEAEASLGTHLGAGVEHVLGAAVPDPGVLVDFLGAGAAGAVHEGDLLLHGRKFQSHDGGHLLRHGVAADDADRGPGLAVHHALGRTRAAGVAAAAAVGPCQHTLHLGDARVLIDVEYLGGHGQDDGGRKPDAEKDEYGSGDHIQRLLGCHALEGEKGQGHESGHDQAEGRAPHGHGDPRQVEALADARQEHQGEQETRARGQGKYQGFEQPVFLALADDGDAEHRAVGGDQRQEDAQRLVQRGNGLFQEHLHELHQGGDDQDEGDGLEVAEVVGREQEFLHAPGDDRGHGGHEDHGQPHADGHARILGRTDERAVAQVLRQHDVVDEDGGDDEDEVIHGASLHSRLLRAHAAGLAVVDRAFDGLQPPGLALPVGQGVHARQEHAQADERARGLDHEAERLVPVAHDLHAEPGAVPEQLTQGAEEGQRDGEAQAHAQPVRNGEQDRVLGGERLGAAQDDAVDHDKRHEDAELQVERVGVGLHEQLHANHERGGDHDEAGDAHLGRDDLAQQRDQQVGQGQDEDDRQAHAEAVIGGLGHGQGRAKPEDQLERRQVLPQTLREFLPQCTHDDFPRTPTWSGSCP